MANQCAFGDAIAIDAQIALQIIQGCKNPHVRKKALHDSHELAGIIKFAKSVELSEVQAKFVEDYVHLDVSGISQMVKQEALAVGGRHNTSLTQEVLRIKQTSVAQNELQVATFITKLHNVRTFRVSQSRKIKPMA